MQRTGLEWLHRMAQEPGRLTARYLRDDLPFFGLLMLESYRQGRDAR
jgi:N-acetylglucosaminyldiphosphoundecaprenol N-acetyl-beta-D-mannosaminyltransferase